MKNNIIKSELYEWRKIKDLQPKGFKTSLRDDVLKKTFEKHGISHSFSVWQDKNGDVYCIDGHQRKRVLEELSNEGVEIPELLMCEFIEAKNKKQASEILIEVFNQKHSEMDFFEFEKFVDEFDLDIDLDVDSLYTIQTAAEVDYSILDEDENSEEYKSALEQMTGSVKKAIQIEFESEHYEEAYNLVKFWREQNGYVGGMIMEYLKSEKEKI
jgi:hypothetical protein